MKKVNGEISILGTVENQLILHSLLINNLKLNFVFQ